MDEKMSEFLQAEYGALRAEILATQRHSFQVVGAGALLIPGINYIIHTKAEALAAGLPVLVIIVVLMYLGDVHAITGCGRYIRERIEKPILGDEGGWEQWLQRKESDDWWSDRTAERYTTASIALLFLSYFAVATWLAYDYLFPIDPSLATAVHALYVVIGAWLALHLKRSLPISTEAVKYVSALHRLFVGWDRAIRIPILRRPRKAPHSTQSDAQVVYPDAGTSKMQ